MAESDFGQLKETEESTGVGADIFIRKLKPGAMVGVGYYVDIYENGLKVDSKRVKTKKEVTEILDMYKDKYNTLRSFEIESQQHITYKTKEERGEVPLKKPEKPKKTEEELKKERKEQREERGETAMQTIDTILIRKASVVEKLLNRLKYPTLPIKRWAETAVEQGSVDIFPETPPAENSTDTSVVDEKTVAKQMVSKLIEYTQANAQKPVDDLYNGIKHWMSIVKKKLRDWERMAGQSLDRATIAQLIKGAVTSGDPAIIKNFSGDVVTPEIAVTLQKVTLMEIGSSQDKGVLAESIGKAASLEDEVAKVLGVVSKSPEAEAKYEAASALKETFGDSIPDIIQMLPETFHGKAVEKAIMEMEQDAKNKSDGISTTAVNPTSINPTVEIQIKAFLTYAKESQKTASLDTLFEDWINLKNIDIEDARIIYSTLLNSIDDTFGNRIAVPTGKPLFDIKLLDDKGMVIMEGDVAFMKGAAMRPIVIPTGPLAFGQKHISPLAVQVGNALEEGLTSFISTTDEISPEVIGNMQRTLEQMSKDNAVVYSSSRGEITMAFNPDLRAQVAEQVAEQQG